MKKVLMVAYHFPPCIGGSGVLRTLKFCKYLPEHGWEPTVLTVTPGAYELTGNEQIKDIPATIPVYRAFTIDAGRHLAFRGRYPRFAALPDRWGSWWVSGVLRGLKIIRENRPNVIWSTYPLATAHLLGLTLSQLTGIPWVADFRDWMTEDGYPENLIKRKCFVWIEREVVKHAQKLVFTTENTRDLYVQRYSELPLSRCEIIQNGFDENDFQVSEKQGKVQCNDRAVLRLVHAGLLYPKERNPIYFLQAISRLKREGEISYNTIRVEFRGEGVQELCGSMIKQLDIEDLIFLLPSLPYQDSLLDCSRAGALLIFQGKEFNAQIPAKIYEYLYMHKPILALTHPLGATTKILKHCGGATILDMENSQAIYEALPKFLCDIRNGLHQFPKSQEVSLYSRWAQAKQLAQCLQSVNDQSGLA